MAAGDLVQDPQPNLLASAHRTVGKAREYEFAFPLTNNSLGNTAWERHKSYQMAVLVGPMQDVTAATRNTWMSDQILIRIGSPSSASIYHPPLHATPDRPEPPKGSHGHQ